MSRALFLLFILFSPCAQANGSNCWFIPGCLHLMEASAGPLSAFISTSKVGGQVETKLSVTYRENEESKIKLCKHGAAVTKLLLIVGPWEDRHTLEMPMSIYCASHYESNSGLMDTARWSMTREENPELWEAIFPKEANGRRAYSLEMAIFNSLGHWDSMFGNNYHLKLRSRGHR